MDREKTLKQLTSFKERVKEKFPLQKIIFFGSHVTGKPHQDSDIDLLIVSKKFRKLNFFERGSEMYKFWKLNMPVDFLCYTPEEFEKLKKRISIVSEALREGIEV